MKNLGYPRSLFFIDMGLVLAAAAITYCLGLTNKLDEPTISGFFQFILYILDFSILLSFEVSIYRQYRRVKYEVAIAWGQQVIAPRHLVTLIGG